MTLFPSLPRVRWFVIFLLASGAFIYEVLDVKRPERHSGLLMPLWVQTVSGVPYGPYAANRLDLMLPRWSFERTRPAVMVFHGGAWKFGNRNDMTYEVCRRYLHQGFLVANVDYRLGSIAPAVDDAIMALRWFSRVAPTRGADPRRIVVTGASAGAHLALLAAFQSGVRTAAVVNFFGPTDLSLLTNPLFRDVLPPGKSQVLALRLSPLTYMHAGLPPVFSVQGADDRIVPPEQTSLLTASIRKAGGDASALFIAGGKHGFSPQQQEIAYDAVFSFLRSHGILDP